MATAGVRVDGILFDVDETLFDRRRAQTQVLAALPRALPDLLDGVALADLQAAWSRSDRETENHAHDVAGNLRATRNARSALFLRILGLDEARADDVTAAYLELYPTVDAPVDGAAETVAACARRWPLGIVSNAYPDVQYRKLATLGLTGFFRCVVLSEEYGGPRKPAPQIFHHGCQRLGTEPGTTLYVGDSWANDVVGARDAGLLTCWLNRAGDPPPPGETAPAWELRHLGELLERLDAPQGRDALP